MVKNFFIRGNIQLLLLAVLFFILILFVEGKAKKKVCRKILVNISNEYQNYFVDEADVLRLINNVDGGAIGKSKKEIDLKKLELKIETDKFIHDAQVYTDVKGNVVVRVSQNRPIARIIYSQGDGAYISNEASILPLSKKFTSRVLLIRGEYANHFIGNYFTKKEIGKNLFNVIAFIDQDPFLKAQIVEVDIDSQGNLTFYPQVGKQYIQFGPPEDWEEKFEKIKMAYKQILPSKGWAYYTRIDVRFKNQIVCE